SPARIATERRDAGRAVVDPLERGRELVVDRVDDVRGVPDALFGRIARGKVVVRDAVEHDAIVAVARTDRLASHLRVVGLAAVEVDVGAVADAPVGGSEHIEAELPRTPIAPGVVLV